MRPSAALLAAALVAAATPVWAQSADTARVTLAAATPGAVTTAAVPLPPALAASPTPLRYVFTPASGVRLAGPAEGTAVPAGGRLPFTYALSRSAPAGPQRLAVVRVEGASGVWTAELWTTVGVRRALKVELRPDTAAALARRTALAWAVANEGNAPDTVRLALDLGEGAAASGWRPAEDPGELVLQPGERREGSWRVVPPTSGASGASRIANLAAEGRAGTVRASSLVSAPDAGERTAATLPASVFLGGSSSGVAGDPGSVHAVVQADGEVSPGTRLSLFYRNEPAHAAVPASFRNLLLGPRFRAALTRPDWSVAAGDVSVGGLPLTGGYLFGTGAAGRVDRGRFSGDFYAARPGGPGGDGGHAVYGEGRWETGLGDLGLAFSDLRRSASGARVQALALRDLLAGGGHRLDAAAGLVRVSSADGDETGPAVDLAYAFLDGRTSITARVRRTPAVGTGGEVLPNELFLGGNLPLTRSLSVVAWGSSTSAPVAGGGEDPYTRAASAGVEHAAGRLRLGVFARASETGGPGLLAAARQSEQRSVLAQASLPVGPVSLEASAEAGASSTDDGGTEPLWNWRGGLRWLGRTGWATFDASWRDDAYFDGLLRVDGAGALRLRAVDLEAGGGGAFEGGAWDDGAAVLWTGATWRVTRLTALVGGVEYLPWAADGGPWRVSLGVRRGVSVPLPAGSGGGISGVVFEDLDGDRERDPGEPGVPGVRVKLGSLQARTASGGRFGFDVPPESGLEPRIDPSSLPVGTLTPPAPRRPGRARVLLPLMRAAGLEVALYHDENGDRARGPAEPAAPRLRVTLTDAEGRPRDEVADSAGVARFAAVFPGAYTLTVHPPALPGRPAPEPVRLTLSLAPGEQARREVGVIGAVRRIRFGPAQAPEQPPAPAAPTVPAPAAVATLMVRFDLSSAELGPEGERALREWRESLPRALPRLCVVGHTDERGSERANLELGRRRAEAVRRYLVGLGLDAAQVSVATAGESRPADPAQTEEAWAKNRRAEVGAAGVVVATEPGNCGP